MVGVFLCLMSCRGKENQWSFGKAAAAAAGAVNIQKVGSIVRDIGDPCLSYSSIKVVFSCKIIPLTFFVYISIFCELNNNQLILFLIESKFNSYLLFVSHWIITFFKTLLGLRCKRLVNEILGQELGFSFVYCFPFFFFFEMRKDIITIVKY